MSARAFCIVLMAAFPFCESSVEANDKTSKLTAVMEQPQIEWRYNGRRVLVYSYAPDQFKPYVRELHTLRGENVVRDAPADHLHHHGLMYAVHVNGINFWEEKTNPGRQVHQAVLHNSIATNAALAQATFSHLIHWLPPSNPRSSRREEAHSSRKPRKSEPPHVGGYSLERSSFDSSKPLLIERRTLTLTVDEPKGEVALEWKAEFEAGAQDVKLHGTDYNGLGMRFAESFDRVARVKNSEGAPYTGKGTHNVIPAKWSVVSGEIAGRPVQVALFASPKNKRATTFFTLVEPFAYLSATQGLDKAPLEYAAGERFTLRYLLTVYSDSKPAEFLAARYREWIEH